MSCGKSTRNEYVFFSPRGEYQHVHKDSLNAHIKRGYKGLTTAHGFRHLALTAGQEVLKVDHEIIQRQMTHTLATRSVVPMTRVR